MLRRLTLLLCALLVPVLVAGAQAAPDDYAEKTVKHKKDVTDLRGLPFTRDVTVGVYSKAELTAFIKGELDRELPKEKADKYQRAYAKFGLIPKDLDLYKAYLSLFESSIAGFYHPRTKELRLIRPADQDDAEQKAMKAMGIDMEAITLVHELTHAAQDQNFELSTLPLEDETNDDLIAALKAVIEGDASAVGWRYGLGEQFDARIGLINAGYKMGMLPGEANKLPAYFKLTLTFPYGYGTDFVLKVLRGTNSGLKEASKMFKEWPLSTEQILHPAKYYQERDNPTLIVLPGLDGHIGGGWKETMNNVHGEFSVKILLREHRGDNLRAKLIDDASAGWDGDRYAILENADHQAMYVWYTTWDSEQDAQEFQEAYALALEKKYGVAERPGAREGALSFESADGPVYLERRGSDVLAIDGGPKDVATKAAAIWSSAKKSEMTGFERLKRFVCEKDGVKTAFSGKCPTCGQPLEYKDDKPAPEKKKQPRDFKVK
ncbi:MAG TPA: hypothetical protein VEJ18_08460 [Planctomycetota bacterium]|nr:hypothetical protein [Planctomycetota bacterium]